MARRYHQHSRRLISNGIGENLLSPKWLAKVRQFPGATITNMCDHLKPILKRKPEILFLHIGTSDTSKYTSNEIVNKLLALKKIVVNQNNACS